MEAVMVASPNVGKPIGKIRNPWKVILLQFVTFGIYGIVWNYSILEELRLWRGQGWSGTTYLIFQFIFPFPLFALPWLMPAYIGRMYQEDGETKPITGLSGFWTFLPIVGSIIWVLEIQNKLNTFWNAKNMPA